MFCHFGGTLFWKTATPVLSQDCGDGYTKGITDCCRCSKVVLEMAT